MEYSTCYLSPFVLSIAVGCVAANASENLALGKPVCFAPAPDYHLTAQGGTDATDLTDDKLTTRPDKHLWFDRSCVGWSYPGLVQLSVDLGKPEPIGEVAIRFQGGSPQAGIAFPGWVDLVASLDGKVFYRVASYSKWTPGDRAKYGIPREAGQGWVHQLVFPNANVIARHVGLSFYGSGLNVADELYVMHGNAAKARQPDQLGEPVPFATTGISVYWHKPALMYSRNVVTGNPVGLLVAPEFERQPFEVVLDLPKGLDLLAGGFGKSQDGPVTKARVGDMTRCVFKLKGMTSSKAAGHLYFSGDWPPGQRGQIRYRTRWANGSTPDCGIGVTAIEIPLRFPGRAELPVLLAL